jgi:DNA gyrase/topoisomerase IV subunit B
MTNETIKNKSNEYKADQIIVLEGLDPVKKKTRNVYWKHGNNRTTSFNLGNS